MVKGDNKYPLTMAATLHFLQYHDLCNSVPLQRGRFGNTLAQEGEEDKSCEATKSPDKREKMVSKPCGKHKDGSCPYKTPHTWKECPTNKWGISKDKTVSSNSTTLLCTYNNMEETMFNEDNPVMSYIIVDDDNDEVVDNTTNDNNYFYLHNYLYYLAVDLIFMQHELEKENNANNYIFMQCNLERRIGATMSQVKGQISKNWVLLDSQSTVDLFSNRKLLRNLRWISNTLAIHCNMGTVTTNIMGNLPGYGPVWYYKDGMASIISLYLIGKRFNVEYNNQMSEDFTLWKEYRSCRKFKPVPKELYYCDMSEVTGNVLTNYCLTVADNVRTDMVNTVKENLKLFNQR